MRNEWIRILSRITLISQLGLSFIVPPLLLLCGAMWLQSRFGLGDWVLLLAIFTGILSGGFSVYSLIRAELMRDRRLDGQSSDRSVRKEHNDETGSGR